MIESDSDDELSEKEDEKTNDFASSQDDYSCQADVERVSNASGSVIIKGSSRLSIDNRGTCIVLSGAY